MMSATMLVMLFLAKLEATILIMQLEMQVLPVREKMVCVIEPLSFWFVRSLAELVAAVVLLRSRTRRSPVA